MNKIALLNDAFRTTLSGGTVLLTAGVHELPDMVKAAAIQKVATFDDVQRKTTTRTVSTTSAASSSAVAGSSGRLTTSTNAASSAREDPADPQKTTRILTIMLASEY